MIYKEMTVTEARKLCGENGKVLVAIQNMEKSSTDEVFVQKKKDEYDKIFEDVKTVFSIMDDLVKQLNCFTEKQNVYDIKPIGVRKIVLLE